MIAEKCKKRLGWGKHAPDEWSGEDAVWHITTDNYNTMCGFHIGSEDKGWFLYDYPDREASCKRCIKVMKKYGK